MGLKKSTRRRFITSLMIDKDRKIDATLVKNGYRSDRIEYTLLRRNIIDPRYWERVCTIIYEIENIPLSQGIIDSLIDKEEEQLKNEYKKTHPFLHKNYQDNIPRHTNNSAGIVVINSDPDNPITDFKSY